MMTNKEIIARKQLLLSKGWKEDTISRMCSLYNVIVLADTSAVVSFPKHIKFVRKPLVKLEDGSIANCLTRKMLGVIGHEEKPTDPNTPRWNIVLDKLIEDLDNAATHLYTYAEEIYYDRPSPYILTNFMRYACIHSIEEIEKMTKNDKYYDFMKMESW